MIRNKISITVFVLFALLFFINLHYYFTESLSYVIFWLSVISLFIVITYQIFYLKKINNIVIFEIFIVSLLLHLVYQVGYYGLRGSDSYIDYNFLKNIINNHTFNLGQDVEGWPMLHLFSSMLSIVTKINPLQIAKFLPSFISAIIVIPLYLLSYNIYRNKKVALFSCLIFITIPQFVSFEGLFVRETYAIFIMALSFYIIYISKRRRDYRFTLLAFILIPVIILSHSLTSFIFIVLLTIFLIANKLMTYIYRKDINMVKNLTGKINIKTIYLITLIALFAYWVYHAFIILISFADILKEMMGLEHMATYAQRIHLEAPIVTLRGNIIFYGFFLFNGLCLLILLIKLITKRNNQKIEDASFIIFFAFCIFYGFLALFVLGHLAFPQRFLTFGWLFGIIPLVGVILGFKKTTYKNFFIIFLILFCIFNLYNINPNYYTGNASRTGVIATEKEYLIAEQIQFPDEYYGYGGAVGAIYDVQGIQQRVGGKDLESIVNFHNSSTLAIINDELYLNNLENIKEKSGEYYVKVIEILFYKNKEGINKICDMGNIYVLQGDN